LKAICAYLRHPNRHGGAPLDEVAEFNSISREVDGQPRGVQMEARPDNIAATFVS